MKDCSAEITGYHNDCVRLNQKAQDKLRDNRDANRKRVKRGQERNGKPVPADSDFVTQGSVAMFTINQHPDNSYDIDDGVIFDRAELKGPQGADMTALEAREMIRSAVDDGSFNTPPKRKNKCVRVFYDAGHNVDIPVYRRYEADGEIRLDHAATDWRERDPQGVTNWFNDAVKERSPDETNGRQMRRVVRLSKSWAKSRASWTDMPSGFVLSVLVDEAYVGLDGRDDQAFHETLKKIKSRLHNRGLEVDHPVVTGESLTNGPDDSRMRKLRDRLDDALVDLAVLEEPSCKKSAALKAWKGFFKTDSFDEAIKEAEEGERAAAKALLAGLSITSCPKAWCPRGC